MKIIFLSNFFPINSKNIYTDFVNELVKNNHEVYVFSPNDKLTNKFEKFNLKQNLHIFTFRTGKYFNVGLLTKLITFLVLPFRTNQFIKKHLPIQSYDLLIYHSPPITFYFTVRYLLKIRKVNKTFLLQKDFFPQNAVDLKLINKFSIAYFIFRLIEKEFFKISNYIGVMSIANKNYLLNSNPFFPKNRVVIFPNTKKMSTFKPVNNFISHYPIRIFFGGNIGLPQDVDFFIRILDKLKNDRRFFFVISGRGNQKYKINDYLSKNNLNNVENYEMLSNENFFDLLKTINLSLVTLNYNFTIPNYPSRILDFIDYYIPILLSVDSNNDLDDLINEYKIGFYCKSDNYLNVLDILYNYEKLIANIRLADFDRLKRVLDVSESVKIIHNVFKN